ncbi:T9SS type A sorting domain-containing protein [Adhaeribacter swui]|uniref:T9SS type A sorting domain-containing protein n=1 Tax=Adhaeribacter swui TaxID=2086471 RepID=A0A7G7GE34_9BACT|nr:T9SS type A sorting domain-containing protein [Adhaeribacter swui]QNF35418.1 T9SS type A sorting domain-containing protein [Adhaeribacter swui]
MDRKTDKEGNLLWEKTLGGSGEDEAYSVGLSQGENVFIAGTSSSGKSSDKSKASKGGKDYWLVTLDQNGTKLWDKTFGGSQDDILRASTYTMEGHYVLAGSSYSGASEDKTQHSQGSSDYWIVEVDEQGRKVYDKRFGGSRTEDLRTVTQTRDGGLLLGGKSDSPASGDVSQSTWGSSDYWLVKTYASLNSLIAPRTATAAETSIVVSQTFLAYPNPFQEKLTITFSLPDMQKVVIRILDGLGKPVTTLFQAEAQAKQTYQVEWHTREQEAGMYLLQLQTPTGQNTQKVMLRK